MGQQEALAQQASGGRTRQLRRRGRSTGVRAVTPLLCAALLLAACDAAPPEDHAAEPAPLARKPLPYRDDPAMAAYAQPSEADAAVEADAEPPADEQPPTGLAIDSAAGLVYVPAVGWMDVPSFAALYENEPDKLPGSFDHAAVHELLSKHNN